ncbi:MAG: ABC transporter permease [Acidimicrobiia bacterium]|nr:MAG: ABC transporter permease [Acidimicrobiia bacterium]
MAIPLSLRVVEAEVRTYRRTWRGSVFTSFLNPILYLLAMGVGLGSLVDANLPAGIEGVSYLAFLAPGLLVATAMQTGAGEGSWKVMAAIEWTQTWKARLATPIGIPSLVLGHIYWGALRVLMVSTIFAVVMAAFRIAPLLESLAAVVPAMFVGVAMVAATTAFTVRLKNVAGLPMFFRFVVIPMFLFSGVFFPITNLPGWLQPVAVITPIYHGVELARAIVVGTTPAVSWWVSIGYLVTISVVSTWIAVGPMRRRMTP